MKIPAFSTVIVFILTPILFGASVITFAQDGGGVSDAQCQKYVHACGKELAKVRINNPACKPLRKCKQICVGEKRVCKTSCRDMKQECKNTCKKRYGKGKEYRQCKNQCRNLKKDCKKDCRIVKTDCKQVCRTTYKTTACKKERAKNAAAIFKASGACLAAGVCLTARSGETSEAEPDR